MKTYFCGQHCGFMLHSGCIIKTGRPEPGSQEHRGFTLWLISLFIILLSDHGNTHDAMRSYDFNSILSFSGSLLLCHLLYPSPPQLPRRSRPSSSSILLPEPQDSFLFSTSACFLIPSHSPLRNKSVLWVFSTSHASHLNRDPLFFVVLKNISALKMFKLCIANPFFKQSIFILLFYTCLINNTFRHCKGKLGKFFKLIKICIFKV